MKIEDVTALLIDLLQGKIPEKLDIPAEETGEDQSESLLQLYKVINELLEKFSESSSFINALSHGNLQKTPPKKNFLTSPFKQLHANIKHLVWQTQRIAAGDLNQQIDFLGDFSESFNSMILSLREKKKLERELKEAHDSLDLKVKERTKELVLERDFSKNMIDTAQAIILVLNVDGTIELFNPYMEEISGTKLDEVKGKDWFETFLPDQDGQKLREEFKQDIGSMQASDNINIILTKDGRELYIEWHYKTFQDSSGDVLGLLAIGQDITKQKKEAEEKAQLEARLRQATKMQAVGTMAGGIAHEFNNILAVIMGCTEMAREEMAQDSFAKVQLDNVMTASSRVKNLVKQILSFSRQSQQNITFVSLCPLVKETVKMVQTSIPSSIDLKVNVESSGCNTLVDPTEIQQIIMNLCSNAVWAMKERGTIEVNLHQTYLKTQEASKFAIPEGKYIKLLFRDNGQGMDSETKSRIFDPFFTQKEVGEGTGMGLSIVYSIMESYGGSITVESEAGKGATFHLYFPVTDGPIVEKKKQLEDILKGNERILFVDDEKIYAEMSARMIRRFGYDVDLKVDSVEALEAFKAAPENFDLVITDQIMPKLSGEELVKEIRSIKHDIPTILCTGYSTQMDEDKANSLGINGFVYKPIEKVELAKLIRKVLDAT